MTLQSRQWITPQTIFWSIVFIVFFALVWLLNDMLAPFFTGLAIAYLLNPVVTSFSRRLPRSIVAFLVLISFALIVACVVMVLSPMIGRQAAEFFNNLPQYIDEIQAWAKPHIDKALGYFDITNFASFRDVTGGSVNTILAEGKNVIPSLWIGGKAIIGVVTFLVITPVVAFYCLRDWPMITRKVDQLFPREHTPTIRSIFREFDLRLAGFVRGQLLVCICLGTFYAIALTLVGLNYGLAIGAIAGILSFIPYVGSTFGFVSSVTIAFVQFSGFEMPLVVIALFFIGQLIEANFLTPKLVGERVGLHPVWVIFALMAGGTLFGFSGLLLAVPSAALIGVLVRHGIARYQQSEAYLGEQKEI